jgi:hypothetical protein
MIRRSALGIGVSVPSKKCAGIERRDEPLRIRQGSTMAYAGSIFEVVKGVDKGALSTLHSGQFGRCRQPQLLPNRPVDLFPDVNMLFEEGASSLPTLP